MLAWTSTYPYLTFFLVIILGFFVAKLIAYIMQMVAVIFRGWEPASHCEECLDAIQQEREDG